MGGRKKGTSRGGGKKKVKPDTPSNPGLTSAAKASSTSSQVAGSEVPAVVSDVKKVATSQAPVEEHVAAPEAPKSAASISGSVNDVKQDPLPETTNQQESKVDRKAKNIIPVESEVSISKGVPQGLVFKSESKVDQKAKNIIPVESKVSILKGVKEGLVFKTVADGIKEKVTQTPQEKHSELTTGTNNADQEKSSQRGESAKQISNLSSGTASSPNKSNEEETTIANSNRDINVKTQISDVPHKEKAEKPALSQRDVQKQLDTKVSGVATDVSPTAQGENRPDRSDDLQKSETADKERSEKMVENAVVETKTELVDTKTELVETKTELVETKTELVETKTELVETKTELPKSVEKSQNEVLTNAEDQIKEGISEVKSGMAAGDARDSILMNGPTTAKLMSPSDSGSLPDPSKKDTRSETVQIPAPKDGGPRPDTSSRPQGEVSDGESLAAQEEPGMNTSKVSSRGTEPVRRMSADEDQYTSGTGQKMQLSGVAMGNPSPLSDGSSFSGQFKNFAIGNRSLKSENSTGSPENVQSSILQEPEQQQSLDSTAAKAPATSYISGKEVRPDSTTAKAPSTSYISEKEVRLDSPAAKAPSTSHISEKEVRLDSTATKAPSKSNISEKEVRLDSAAAKPPSTSYISEKEITREDIPGVSAPGKTSVWYYGNPRADSFDHNEELNSAPAIKPSSFLGAMHNSTPPKKLEIFSKSAATQDVQERSQFDFQKESHEDDAVRQKETVLPAAQGQKDVFKFSEAPVSSGFEFPWEKRSQEETLHAESPRSEFLRNVGDEPRGWPDEQSNQRTEEEMNANSNKIESFVSDEGIGADYGRTEELKPSSAGWLDKESEQETTSKSQMETFDHRAEEPIPDTAEPDREVQYDSASSGAFIKNMEEEIPNQELYSSLHAETASRYEGADVSSQIPENKEEKGRDSGAIFTMTTEEVIQEDANVEEVNAKFSGEDANVDSKKLVVDAGEEISSSLATESSRTVQQKNGALKSSRPSATLSQSDSGSLKKSKEADAAANNHIDSDEELEHTPMEFSLAGSSMKGTELSNLLGLLSMEEEPVESDVDALMEMEKSLKDVLSRHRELSDSAAAKDDLIETLREQLEDSTNRYESLSERAQRFESELKDRSEAMKQMQKQLKDYAGELSKLKRGALISKEEYATLQQSVKRRGERAEELERDLEVKEALLNSMRLDLSMLKKQCEELGNVLAVRETERANLQSELVIDRKELARLRDIISEFDSMKMTLEDNLRQSWRSNPDLESQLRDAKMRIGALERELKFSRAKNGLRMRAIPRQAIPKPEITENLNKIWDLRELEQLTALKQKQTNKTPDTAISSDLDEPLRSHYELCQRCFPEDADLYFKSFATLYEESLPGIVTFDDVSGACKLLNPVDWERVYAEFFLTLSSLSKKEDAPGKDEAASVLWYQKPWYSVLQHDLAAGTETSFKNWMAHVWGLGFRNILLLGETTDQSRVEQLQKNGFRVCVEGKPMTRVRASDAEATAALTGESYFSAMFFERSEALVDERAPTWSRLQPKGDFWSANGPEWMELNLSTYGALRFSFLAFVEELKSGPTGKVLDLSQMRFGTTRRKRIAAQCESLSLLFSILASRCDSIVVLDVPDEMHAESLKWERKTENTMILSRRLQVQMLDTVLGGHTHALLRTTNQLSRSDFPYMSPMEVPYVGLSDELSKESFKAISCRKNSKFAAVYDATEGQRACGAFLSMIMPGIPVLQHGCELVQRNAKLAGDTASKRAVKLGIRTAEDLRDFFISGMFAPSEKRLDAVLSLMQNMNKALGETYDAPESLQFVSVSLHEAEDDSVACFVRNMPAASKKSNPVVGLVNTSNRLTQVRIDIADILVKLQVPVGAFKLEHIFDPSDDSKFDGSFGTLSASIAPYSYACFRLKTVQPALKSPGRLPETAAQASRSNTRPVLLEWQSGGRSVVATGSFLNWNQVVPLFPVKSDVNTFVSLHYLKPGSYEMKFIVDGSWVCSSNMPLSTPSASPTDPAANNILKVAGPPSNAKLAVLHSHFMAVSRSRQIPSNTGNLQCLRPVVLVWTKGGSSVSISTSTTNWADIYDLFMHETGGYHWTIINFPIGSHYYRFCVDGYWTVAEEHPVQTDDKGIRSNFIKVS